MNAGQLIFLVDGLHLINLMESMEPKKPKLKWAIWYPQRVDKSTECRPQGGFESGCGERKEERERIEHAMMGRHSASVGKVASSLMSEIDES